MKCLCDFGLPLSTSSKLVVLVGLVLFILTFTGPPKTIDEGTDTLKPMDLTKSKGEDQTAILQELGVQNVDSDTAYLKHCCLDQVDKQQFSIFREAILKQIGWNDTAQRLNGNATDLKDEVTLQALELYARAEGNCNYSMYKPTVRIHQSEKYGIQQQLGTIPGPPPEEARIVFAISAFDDFPQLQALVESIKLPQHLIIIHLERRTPDNYARQVRQLAGHHFPNVVVLQYGSITYPSDSLSNVFLEIMRFVTEECSFVFDYWMTLGASAYPLYAAKEMAQKLKREPPYVRIGKMIFFRGRGQCSKHVSSFGITYSRGMGSKELITVRGFQDVVKNLTDTYGDPFPSLRSFVPSNIQEMCAWKTNSGNTAAYDGNALKAILQSPDAAEILSRFKQAGGCCNEEFSWGAALTSVGRENDLDQTGMMWQAWPCHSAVHNIRLVFDNDTCVHIFDSSAGWVHRGRQVFGMEGLANELIEARRRGHLFARKFHSSDQYWMNYIKSSLHQQ